jgi:hypothetical protein
MNQAGGKPDRALAVIVAVIAVLVAGALALVFFRPQPELRPASTPEGVVQRYAAAIIDGDEAAAAGFLADELRNGCRHHTQPVREDLRVTLLSTQVHGDTADVTVAVITSDGGDPFGASEYEARETFDLLRDQGQWLVSRVPWQFASCPPPEVK